MVAITGKLQDTLDNTDALTGMLKDMIDRVKHLIPHSHGIDWCHFPSHWWESINVGDILFVIKMYLMYVNVHSRTMKLMIVMAVLYHLGILQKVIDASLWLWASFKESFIQETDSSSWMDYIVDMLTPGDPSRAAWFCGVVVILLCGVKVKAQSLLELGKRVMRMFTNMHFVGLGLLGGKRIFEYIHSVIQVSIDWMKENVFGIKKEIESNTVRIVKWAVRLKFFCTEEGLQLIRTSEEALNEASKIYDEGVQLLMMTRSNPNWAPRDMINMVSQMQKDALTIQNVIYLSLIHI